MLHGLSLVAVVTIVATVGLLAVVVDRSRHDAAALALAPGGLALYTVTMVAAAASALIVFSLVDDGRDPWPTTFRTLGPDVPPGVAPLDAPDPALPGEYTVERLTYGAGANPRRPEFGTGRDLTSRTVDATRLLPEWKGLRGRVRDVVEGVERQNLEHHHVRA